MLAMCVALSASRSISPGQTKSVPSSTSFHLTQSVSDQKPLTRASYVGDEACRSCHQDKAESYWQTAHHRTSQQAGKETIAGPFTPGANILKTSNPGLFFRMDAKEGGFYQTAVLGVEPVTTSRSEKFDVVVGSGRKGQTYLYWKGDQLFQLPVSYWVEIGQWVNSPGYRDGVADFTRPVVSRCLECHGTYAESVAGPPPPNHYKRASVTLGIGCERCHGPGRDHVEGVRSGSAEGTKVAVNPSKMPHDRQIEVCAQCHGGPGKRLPASVFFYVPGEPLDNYIELDHFDPSAKVDVHGNQVALLQRSRCFQSSASMSCFTCHNVHVSQRDVQAFSDRCLTCHKIESCGQYSKIGPPIVNKCIDCHMPNQQSNVIVSDSNGRQVRPEIRTHWIKVYPEDQAQEER
jgi:Cytochrome c554 and c-prime